jgi:hypothetical protein
VFYYSLPLCVLCALRVLCATGIRAYSFSVRRSGFLV